MNPNMSMITIRTSLIYKQMDALSLTTDELAAAIGISAKVMERILVRGTCSPIVAGKLSKVLGIHMWELVA